MDVPDDASWCERPGDLGRVFDKRPSCRWGAFASGLLGAMERMRCVVTSLIRLARIGVGRGPTEATQTSSRQLEAALDPAPAYGRAQSAA